MSLAPFAADVSVGGPCSWFAGGMAGVAGAEAVAGVVRFFANLAYGIGARPSRKEVIATPRPFWEAGASTVQRPYALGHPPRGGCPTGRVVTRTDLRDHEADLGDHHRPICVIAMHRSPLTSKSPGGIRPGRSFGDQAAAPTPVCNALASFLQVLR